MAPEGRPHPATFPRPRSSGKGRTGDYRFTSLRPCDCRPNNCENLPSVGKSNAQKPWSGGVRPGAENSTRACTHKSSLLPQALRCPLSGGHISGNLPDRHSQPRPLNASRSSTYNVAFIFRSGCLKHSSGYVKLVMGNPSPSPSPQKDGRGLKFPPVEGPLHFSLRSSVGSFAMLLAMRRASSIVSTFAVSASAFVSRA